MRRLDVSIDARIAVAGALAVSLDEFGLAAAERYRALIQQAYRDLVENPERPGVTAPPELPADIRLQLASALSQRISGAVYIFAAVSRGDEGHCYSAATAEL